jgi:hypothetical protein
MGGDTIRYITLIYSGYNNASMNLIKLLNTHGVISDVQLISVDSEKIRKKIFESKNLKIMKVPTVVIEKERGSIEVFEGDAGIKWMNDIVNQYIRSQGGNVSQTPEDLERDRLTREHEELLAARNIAKASGKPIPVGPADNAPDFMMGRGGGPQTGSDFIPLNESDEGPYSRVSLGDITPTTPSVPRASGMARTQSKVSPIELAQQMATQRQSMADE